jgi:hypothetical protein
MRKKKYRHEYEVQTDDGMEWGEPDPSQPPTFELNTVEYVGYEGEGEATAERIHEAIREYETDTGRMAPCVVVGVEDYAAADSFLRRDTGSGLDRHLGCDIHVVPGRMIHVPKPNQKAVVDHLREGDDE